MISQEEKLDSLFPKQAPRLSLMQLRISKLVVLLGDLFAFAFAFILSTTIVLSNNRLGVEEWFIGQSSERFAAWIGIVISGVCALLIRFQHYSDRRPLWDELSDFVKLISFLALLDIAILAFARWNSSRLWWLLVWPLSVVSLLTMRMVTRNFLTWIRVWVRPTVIIGVGQNAQDAALALQSQPELGLQVIGFVGELNDGLINDRSTQPRLSQVLIEQVASEPSIQWVIALEHAESERREYWLRLLAQWGATNVNVIPAMRGVPLHGTDMIHFFSHEVAMLRMRNNLQRWPARLLKRVFDTLVAFILLVVLSPILLLIGCLIRRDGGGALFKQLRVGMAGRNFLCYKFRSMSENAELQLEELLIQQPDLREEWQKERKLQNDPRVSSLGRVLRETSLDELPQLINVIKGDMSLVGPRPVVIEELPRYAEDVGYYLMVRPGMTGLWQVSGRSDVEFDRRVYLDSWYVKNWSLWHDLIILQKTVAVVLRRSGAY